MGRTLAVVVMVLAVLSHAVVCLRVTGSVRVTARARADAILRIKVTPDSGETIEDVSWFKVQNPKIQLNTPRFARYSTLSDGSLKIKGVTPADKGAYQVFVTQTNGNSPHLKKGIFHAYLSV